MDGKLAGSVLLLERAVRNVMQFAGCDLQTAVRLAGLNPASVVRLPRKGKISAGADADITVLTSRGDVQETIVRGILNRQ
jgi:N-acetylglucosamine-6-phosphate deacetylase